jgi:eukaryotic-like serine/threonine-protein kinase
MGAGAKDLEVESTIPGVPRAGEKIDDKYEVETMIGEGAMGIVFVARHLKLDERVAIKVLRPELIEGSPTLVQRFLREARAAISIQSAHVVRVMDVGTLPTGAPYMAMEYLEGSDLQSLLQKQGALPIADAANYVIQACDALAEAHARGIVHRDLKPANLFLTKRFDGAPWIKVLDFGISKAVPRDNVDPEVSLTQTAAILGSPAYMSPEQVRNAKTVDGRADVWSLGVILYKLLTAESPFEGGTFSSLCAAIVADDPPPLRDKRPEIPAALEAIVLRCLAKKPEARFATVEELAKALGPFARGEEVAVVEPPRIERKKKPIGLWIGAAIVMIAIAAIAIPRMMKSEPEVVPPTVSSSQPVPIASPKPAPPATTEAPAPTVSASAAPSMKLPIKGMVAKPLSPSTTASGLQPAPAPAPSAPDPLEHAQ